MPVLPEHVATVHTYIDCISQFCFTLWYVHSFISYVVIPVPLHERWTAEYNIPVDVADLVPVQKQVTPVHLQQRRSNLSRQIDALCEVDEVSFCRLVDETIVKCKELIGRVRDVEDPEPGIPATSSFPRQPRWPPNPNTAVPSIPGLFSIPQTDECNADHSNAL